MDAGDRPPSSSGAADDAGVRPPSTSGDAAESDADLAVPARVADFSGVRAWLPRADTRLSRVLGTALRDAGCAVHGARAGGEELAFAAETFVAATELHNPEHERARRACVRACHLAVATLPGDAGEIRSLAEALTSAARADGTKRALIVVSPPRAVVGRATRASSASASSNARARDGKTAGAAGAAGAAARSPPGDAGVCADAERVALRLHRPGSLEVFVLRHGVLYGEGEFADGFLGVMRAAWEGRSVPVFGAGDNVLRLCHARKLAEGVVRVAARALLGVVMRSDGAFESGPSSQGLRVRPDAENATKTDTGQAEKSLGTPRSAEPSFSAPSPPSSPPRVLGVCDAYGQTDTPMEMTQMEIASRIASAFETNIRRFPASRAALFELGASEVGPKPHPSRFVPGARTLEDGRGGCESLLLRFEEDAELDDATRTHAATAGEEDARADLSATARAVTGKLAATGRLEPRSLGGSASPIGALGGGDFRLPASDSSSRRASDPASQADATFAASARAFAAHFPGAAETNPLRFGEAFGAFSFEDAHFGSMGGPVEHPFFSLLAARAAEEAEEAERRRTSDPDADPTAAATEATEATDAEEASGEEEETLWEPAPAPIGGAGAIRDAFVRENGLEPPRVVIRGPPLSRADHLGAAIAEAYTVPLLTPASMVRSFLPRAPDELREKCGDPTWKPRPEAEAGEEAGEEAGAEAASPDAPGHLPDADPASLARAEARAEEEAHALFDALDGATKLELLAFTLDDAAVKKTGYVMAGGVPADPETCASLFTWIPPRPPLRLKEGWDAPRTPEVTGEGGDAEKAGDAETGPETDEPAEPVEEPPYPEESEEEAESRRDAHPDRAPNIHLRLVFDDGGAYAKKVKRADPEGYAAYAAWAEAEDAARDAHEAATEAREEAARAREAAIAEKRNAARAAGEPAPDAASLAEAFPEEPPVEPVETDEVSKWLVRTINRVDVEASEPDAARLSKAKRALGDRARNFVGFPEFPEDDPLHPAALARAQDLVARRREEDEARAERAERAAKLVRRRERELEAREAETLHQRSASLRRYLRDAVMPAVTEAMVTLARVQPEDPAEALAEFLIRTDKKREAEEEAERVAAEAMERAVAEELRLREKERKLAASRRAAAEAQAAIRPRSVVRKVPVIPNVSARRVVAGAAKASSVKSQPTAGEE